ncbi:SAM-dependent methyltransferase [Desulfuribacillus alkaliarsenatis]|uniref:SAM-dependent methyltransferase n=1 Tax=Desulfuribacillus alkaliarsenatis TaxID=766136 RepID=UPI000AF5BD13|nr:class I SAM-dependent methyltransferase [Desulfuribacillus alkaliarsenatis]
MENINEEIVKALDGDDGRLYPYIPYLLQDLWDIGTNPQTVIGLLKDNNIAIGKDTRVLDLGCGKGAVSVQLAKAFGVSVYGIDAMGAFIQEAIAKADEYGVSELCQFEVKDIRDVVQEGKLYDIVIFGAVSPTIVYGNYQDAISSLTKCIKPGGNLILDDGYIEDDSDYQDSRVCKYSELMGLFSSNGFTCIEERYETETVDLNEYYTERIRIRANELSAEYPEQAELFMGYVESQEQECDILANKLVCATWLFKYV